MAESHPKPTDPRFQDLTGQMFGRLTVLFFLGKRTWCCRCICGKEVVAHASNLSRRHRSCGCLRSDEQRIRSRKHGHAVHGHETKEYHIWNSMIMRCHWTKDPGYRNYGGRGITVCQRWRDSFEAFLADVGSPPTPKHQIDRIDNNGNYQPGNVRWVTAKEQQRNKRSNRLLTYQGLTFPVSEWAERIGISKLTLYSRLARGWSAEKALTTPVR